MAELTTVSRCGGCGSENLRLLLDMGMQPLAERETGELYPLRLLECTVCTLVQLSCIVDQHAVFPPDHPYATGNTAALRAHFASLAQDIAGYLPYAGLVVDIGANDGTFLKAMLVASSGSCSLAGVEPTRQIAKLRSRESIHVFEEFFTAALARRMRAELGPASVVTACNVLAHVPDIHDFLDGVKDLLDEDGVFITENHDWASIAHGLQFDTIYHEHLRYYSPASLIRILAIHGFRTEAIEPVPVHGGSFRVTARLSRPAVSRRIEQAALAIKNLVYRAAADGPVYGIGAATRATPLIHYSGIAECLACVCEVPGSEKIGQRIPGTGIEIVPESRLIADQPPYALLLAWHWADSIIPTLRAAGYEGKFIIPLPEARIADA